MASIVSTESSQARYSNRSSPEVQRLQTLSPWVRYYPLPNPLAQPAPQIVSTNPLGPSSRWMIYGDRPARHINDVAPFSLWDGRNLTCRNPKPEEMEWLENKYGAIKITIRDTMIIVTTSAPPEPIPITVGGIPAVFASPGNEPGDLGGTSSYVNPRLTACDHISWLNMTFPSLREMIEITEALTRLANVRRVNFTMVHILVELVWGDGRQYPDSSLPGKVAGRPTHYHHESVPFFEGLTQKMRERILDPRSYLPGPSIGPLPQDDTNYLDEPNWGYLTPGMRVSSECIDQGGSSYAKSTSLGVRLRNGRMDRVTVANHGFPTREVFHPTYLGTKIGEITDRYPELDIAFLKPTPSQTSTFTNRTYFQAESPRYIAGEERLINSRFTFWEVDGMSTGLVTLYYEARSLEQPMRPQGQPPIPVANWRRYNVSRIFGAMSGELMDGLCGAPIVSVDDGALGGFFHLATGDFAQSAMLEDLVAEGWGVV